MFGKISQEKSSDFNRTLQSRVCVREISVDFAEVQAEQQKAPWFESAIGVRCTSFDTELFLPANCFSKFH